MSIAPLDDISLLCRFGQWRAPAEASRGPDRGGPLGLCPFGRRCRLTSWDGGAPGGCLKGHQEFERGCVGRSGS
jgi:hypothetical protein